MEKKMTAKEIAREAQKRIDMVVEEMVAEYGIEKIAMATVRNTMENEVGHAITEIEYFGKILNNKERWGK